MQVPFVRSKGRNLRIRDGKTGEVRTVGPTAWVRFEGLPRGMMPNDDAELYVRVAKSEEDGSALVAENARLAEAEKQRVAAILAKREAKLTGKGAAESTPKSEDAKPSEQPKGKHFGRR